VELIAVTNEPTRPLLRSLELKWIEDDGRRLLFIRDPTGIAPHSASVPAWIAHVLSLFDGERDASGIAAAYELRTGQRLPPGQVESLVQQLDQALFLDSPKFEAAQSDALREYRAGASRLAVLAGQAYPADPAELRAALGAFDHGESYCAATPMPRGVVSPHIDYHRGGDIYAKTWRQAAGAVRHSDLVVIFGTDHSGSAGQITLTRQSYATPLGILPTATAIVDRLAEAIGAVDAFAEELHHRNEHSIELAAVWVRAMANDPPPDVVPILCGSFHEFSEGIAEPRTYERFTRLLASLKDATAGRRVLVVAAADLAHVGPAFGDSRPLKGADKKRLAAADERLLESVRIGDAAGFFDQLRAERDQRKVCGLPPIYLMLRYLGQSDGTIVGYDQCPADAEGGSLVSIAGVLLP
jgi:AmmeMemoRadiSam system protein B